MFGFGRDTDEVNGFLPDWSDTCSTGDDDSLSSFALPELVPLRASPSSDGGSNKLQHPVFRPDNTYCAYCEKTGHSLDYCPTRLKNNQRIANKWCTQGWHSPKVHDDRRVWRCKYCAMHLHEEYVWHWYPKEAMAEEDKFFKHRLQVEKYMA